MYSIRFDLVGSKIIHTVRIVGFWLKNPVLKIFVHKQNQRIFLPCTEYSLTKFTPLVGLPRTIDSSSFLAVKQLFLKTSIFITLMKKVSSSSLPVLEPNFDLSLSQTKLMGHLDATTSGEVVVRVELLLQLQGLIPRQPAGETIRNH